jgi:putative aminopeptidase FrvX
VLREVIETLAPLDRTPCSPGERAAAEWLRERFAAVAGVEATAEEEPSWGTFPPTATALGLLGLAGAARVLAGHRRSGTLAALLSIAGIVDEAQNGPRVLRRALRRRRSTVNVIARLGDRDAERTVAVIAHHDAAQTGVIFDQTLVRRLYERYPERIGAVKTSLPQWWLGLAGPLGTLAAAVTRTRFGARAAVAVGAFATSLAADVWRSDTVPGANDNLSGVAALVGLAELLAGAPPAGVRVLLASCGAEETLQDGIRAFVARHGHELAPDRTSFINLDQVGSPNMAMLEAEGPIWMEDYPGAWLRDEIERCARRLEIPLERGFRARSSTDGVIPARRGHATATLFSMTDWRQIGNYHLPSDVPENIDYGTVSDAVRLVHTVIVELAGRPLARA